MAEYDAEAMPEWAEYVRTMDRLEAIYRDHFPSNRLNYEFEAYWIHHTVWSIPWPAWKHDDVLGQLESIKRSLMALSRFYDLPRAVRDEFHFDAFQRSQGFEGEMTPSKAAFMLPDLYDLLAPSIQAAMTEARQGDEGQTDWDAVNAIDACRVSWWRCTGKQAPNSINEASPFGRFARDIFNALGLKRKARPSIDAWRRVQRNDKNS